MITTTDRLFNQDGTTFIPQFFLSINITDKNTVNVTIRNMEGTELMYSGFPMEHTKEVKEFIEYVSGIAIDKLEDVYPNLTDLSIEI